LKLAEIARVARRHELAALSDEVYRKIVFDSRVSTSIASLPGMRELTTVVDSFSKAYAHEA